MALKVIIFETMDRTLGCKAVKISVLERPKLDACNRCMFLQKGLEESIYPFELVIIHYALSFLYMCHISRFSFINIICRF